MISYSSALRERRSVALEHLAGAPVLLLSRVLDKSFGRDFDEVRHMACEAALLLLDPTKDVGVCLGVSLVAILLPLTRLEKNSWYLRQHRFGPQPF